ncbi:transposase [Methylosinus sp. PW1]|uniref:IS66-like element accessory protein TnpA n=1 Tax=Methylosinus sp. PW1 TaxID=107636 RepID=UPI00055C8AFC|nr:transposase [Methylosinus sp. PW1]
MDHSMLEAMHEGRTYQRVELITGGRRRRSWTSEEKARIVAESAEPNANISDVARRNGVSRGLLTVWRRQAWEARSTSEHEALFAAVRVRCVEERDAVSVASCTIEVSIADATVRVPMGADSATVDAVISALRRSR